MNNNLGLAFVGPVKKEYAFIPTSINGKIELDWAGKSEKELGGQNIWGRWKKYRELTVQYWLMHNAKAEHIGMCQHNWYLSFSQKNLKVAKNGVAWAPFADEFAGKQLGLNSEEILNAVEQYDLIVPKTVNIGNFRWKKFASVREYNLFFSTDYRKEDIDTLLDIAKERHPKFYVYLKKYFDGKELMPCNCFVMEKKLFQEYSELVFDLLFATEEKLEMEEYCPRGQFVLARLAKALLAAFALQKNQEGKKVGRKQAVGISDFSPAEDIKPAFAENNIPLILISSDYYIPYCATCIQSLIQNSNAENNYDIVILGSHISKQNKDHLLQVYKNHKNISVRFYDPYRYFYRYEEDLKLTYRGSIVSYYRILAPYIFTQYKKMVWMDCDIIINRDIAELFAVELGDTLLGAVRDIYVRSFANGALEPWEVDYFTKEYPISDLHNYINTGVVTINLEGFRQCHPDMDEVLKFCTKYKFHIQEQDALNLLVDGKCTYIDARWNVGTLGGMEEYLKHAPKELHDIYMQSRKDPYIVHYVGHVKPWETTGNNYDLGYYFWKYARQTVFYEQILGRYTQQEAGWIDYKLRIVKKNLTPLRVLANGVLPIDSSRRTKARGMLHKMGRIVPSGIRKRLKRVFRID